MIRLQSSGESDVVQLWLVGRSGYTGMRGLLFVWERSGSGGECHWWLQRGRMNLQEVFSLSLLPHSPTLILSVPLSFFLCVRTFTVPSLSLLRPRSPGTTTALSCPVNTHPSSTGRLLCQGQRNTGPQLLFLPTSLSLHGWRLSLCVCVCLYRCWMVNSFSYTWHFKHLIYWVFYDKQEVFHLYFFTVHLCLLIESREILFREHDLSCLKSSWPQCSYPPSVMVRARLKME